MRAIGLDLGSKTIGVAASDELGFTAQAVCTLKRSGLRRDLRALQQLASERDADRFILGLPLNMNGTEGPKALAARTFGQALEELSGLPVVFQDERLTTVAAERALLEGNLSREKRRRVIDQVAACLILQGWLDGRSPRTDE